VNDQTPDAKNYLKNQLFDQKRGCSLKESVLHHVIKAVCLTQFLEV
jgi:hypothetical protein